MKIYLVNKHWYEGHDTICATKNYISAFNFVMQLFMYNARINVSDDAIANYIDELQKNFSLIEIEEIELE